MIAIRLGLRIAPDGEIGPPDDEAYAKQLDLAKSGVYRYTESPDFEILLFAYSVDGGPVQVIDLANGEKLIMR